MLARRASRSGACASPPVRSPSLSAPSGHQADHASLLAHFSGRITIPTEAFHAVLGGQEIKRKGQASDKKKKT